jgi:hypothetical protein
MQIGVIRFFCFFSVSLFFTSFAKSSDHLRPVDGRISPWSRKWQLFSTDSTIPSKRDLLSLMVEESFAGTWFVTLKDNENKDALAVVLVATETEDQTGAKVKVTKRASKTIPNEIALKLNQIWLNQLLSTSYPSTPTPAAYDGITCYLGATTLERSYYLMGQFHSVNQSGLEWILQIGIQLRKYIESTSEDSSAHELNRLRSMAEKHLTAEKNAR